MRYGALLQSRFFHAFLQKKKTAESKKIKKHNC